MRFEKDNTRVMFGRKIFSHAVVIKNPQLVHNIVGTFIHTLKRRFFRLFFYAMDPKILKTVTDAVLILSVNCIHNFVVQISHHGATYLFVLVYLFILGRYPNNIFRLDYAFKYF